MADKQHLMEQPYQPTVQQLERLWKVSEKLLLTKDKSGYQYTYTTLSQIRQKLRPALDELGLVYDTTSRVFEDYIVYRVTVYDLETGDPIKYSELAYPITGDAQVGGSQQTYARRYLLLQVFDLLPEEDDDGAATKGRTASTGNSGNRRRNRRAKS